MLITIIQITGLCGAIIHTPLVVKSIVHKDVKIEAETVQLFSVFWAVFITTTWLI